MAATSAMSDSPTKPRILEQRRCLLLAVTGSTAETIPRSPTLKRILEAGFLVLVKSWLDDILMGTVGEVVIFRSGTAFVGHMLLTKWSYRHHKEGWIFYFIF